MKSIAFPARKSFIRQPIGGHLKALELYTSVGLDERRVTLIGITDFSGTRLKHYLVDLDESVSGDLLHEAGIEEFISEPLSHWLASHPNWPEFTRSKVMGIINATPDSFYPGSRIQEVGQAVDEILDARPDIVDIGGESTRPGSKEITIDEEMKRVRPIIDYVSSVSDIPISLDTRHPEVLEEFAGRIGYVNDITGFSNRRMVELSHEYGLTCIAMHMRGTPLDMQEKTQYVDIVPEILSSLAESIGRLVEAGIDRKRIIIDPGIGFSKDFRGNIAILRDIWSFHIGYGLLVGASRKSFIGAITGEETGGRLPGTLATTAFLGINGTDIIRVHDPKENMQTLDVLSAIYGSQ